MSAFGPNISLTSLKMTFDKYDRHHMGSISVPEFKEYFLSHGTFVDDASIIALLRKYDIDHDGRIDFNEFCRLVNGDSTPVTSPPYGSSFTTVATQNIPLMPSQVMTTPGPVVGQMVVKKEVITNIPSPVPQPIGNYNHGFDDGFKAGLRASGNNIPQAVGVTTTQTTVTQQPPGGMPSRVQQVTYQQTAQPVLAAPPSPSLGGSVYSPYSPVMTAPRANPAISMVAGNVMPSPQFQAAGMQYVENRQPMGLGQYGNAGIANLGYPSAHQTVVNTRPSYPGSRVQQTTVTETDYSQVMKPQTAIRHRHQEYAMPSPVEYY